MRLRMAGIADPIAFENCDALPRQLKAVSHGWSWRQTDDTDEPCIFVTGESGGWRIASRWLDTPKRYDDPADILCALIADLIMAQVANAPGHLCLHAAAARFGDEGPLLAFPAQTEAGKSTLSTVLALSGARLYSDDVLPIDLISGTHSGCGMALGLAPRPRLPLPDILSPAVRDRIAERLVAANSAFGYVGLNEHELAPLGERAPIGAFIRLHRDTGPHRNQPRLDIEPRSEMMKVLLWQNFGERPATAELVSRFGTITSRAESLRLTYGDPVEAAVLLQARFGQTHAKTLAS